MEESGQGNHRDNHPARVNRLVIFSGNLFHSQVLHGDPRDASDPKARVTMNSHMVVSLTE